MIADPRCRTEAELKLWCWWCWGWPDAELIRGTDASVNQVTFLHPVDRILDTNVAAFVLSLRTQHSISCKIVSVQLSSYWACHGHGECVTKIRTYQVSWPDTRIRTPVPGRRLAAAKYKQHLKVAFLYSLHREQMQGDKLDKAALETRHNADSQTFKILYWPFASFGKAHWQLNWVAAWLRNNAGRRNNE